MAENRVLRAIGLCALALIVAFISWMAWSAVEPEPAVDTKQLIIDIPYRLQWRNSEDVLDDNTLKRDYIAWLVSKDIPYFKVDDLQVTTIDDVTREITINCTGDNKSSQNCITAGFEGFTNYGDVVEPFTGTITLSELIKADTHDCLAAWCPPGIDQLRCPINCYARASDGTPPPRCLRPPIIDDAITRGSLPREAVDGSVAAFRALGYSGEYTLHGRRWDQDQCVDDSGATVPDIGQADCEPILMTTTTDSTALEAATPFQQSPLWRDDFNVKIKCDPNYSSANPQIKFGENDQSQSHTYYLDTQCGEGDWHYSISGTCNERCAGFEEDPDVALSARFSGIGVDILESDDTNYTSGSPMKKDFDGFNVKYKCADGWGPQSGDYSQGVYNVLCPTPGEEPVFPTQCERHCTLPSNQLLQQQRRDPSSFQSNDLSSPDPVYNFNDSLFNVTYTCLQGSNPDRTLRDESVALASRHDDASVPAARTRATKCPQAGQQVGFEETCVPDCTEPATARAPGRQYIIDKSHSTYAKGQFSVKGPGGGPMQCAAGYGATTVVDSVTGLVGPHATQCDTAGTEFHIAGCEALCQTPHIGQIYDITGADTHQASKDDFSVTASCKFPQAGAEAVSGPRVYPCQEAGAAFQLTGCYPLCPGATHCSNGKIVLAYSADLMPQSADADIMTQIVNAMKAAGSLNFGTEDIHYYNKVIKPDSQGQPLEIVVEYQIRCPEGEDCGIENLEQVEGPTEAPAYTPKIYSDSSGTSWTFSNTTMELAECVPNRPNILSSYTDVSEGDPGTWEQSTITRETSSAARVLEEECGRRVAAVCAAPVAGGVPLSGWWVGGVEATTDMVDNLCVEVSRRH